MSFDELQSIWDSQQPSEQAIDQGALLRVIKDRDRSFSRIVTATDYVMTLTLLFVAAMFMRDPLLQGHDRVLMIPGIACLVGAAYVWKSRLARKKREIHYDSSLFGLIKKSIDGISSRIARMSKFLWWFACPNLLGLGIALFIIDDSKRYLLTTIFIPAFLACIAFAYWQIRREIRTKLLPEKRRLEELLDKLCSEE